MNAGKCSHFEHFNVPKCSLHVHKIVKCRKLLNVEFNCEQFGTHSYDYSIVTVSAMAHR